MSDKIPESIKKNIRTVLLSKSKGISLPEFLSDYRTKHREPLRFRDFGFSSVQEFMKSIPDVARIVTGEGSEIMVYEAGELKLSAIANSNPREDQDCLKKCVSKSFLLEHDSNVNGMPALVRNGVETDDDDDGLIPDKKGFWSVCVPLHVWKDKDPKDLVALFRQAGDVKQANFIERQAFIRYDNKEDALMAVKTFCDLKTRLARNHFRNPGDAEEIMKKVIGNRNSGNRIGTDSHQKGEINSLRSEISNTVDGRNTGVNEDSTVLEKLFGKFYKDLKLNGSHSEMDNQSESNSTGILSHKDERRYNRPHTDTEHSVPRKTLYFGHIESVDVFRELIKPYDPVTVKVIMTEEKILAFVSMKSIDCAQQAIKDLHTYQQKTKRLYVNFAKRDLRCDNDSVSGESSFESQQDSHRAVEQKKKSTEMPPLISESALGPDADRYLLDCCIYVANFSCNTLESVLRNAFDKYHILDVCMVNNGSAPGCTKAFLYLTTVYDVIQAVIEMNNSCIFERPLQVEVPSSNTLLKSIVAKAIARERASAHQ